jgi:radical SAM protein with 4Fe4S-binding SPASM domain
MHLLDQAAELGCLQVRFTGGEPLLRSDFDEVYLHARGLGMKVLLFTNGRALGRGGDGASAGGSRLADLLARVPPLLPVEVTVYGARRESYEAVSRAPGSYAECRCGLDRLVGRGVPLAVKGAVLPPTRGELDAFDAWVATLPVAEGGGVTRAAAPGRVAQLDLRTRRDDATKNAAIRRLRLPADEVARLYARDEAAFRAARAAFAARFMAPPGATLFRCDTGHRLAIDPYGRAYPCLGLRAPELGVDLVADGGGGPSSLSEALDRFTELRQLEAEDPDYLRRCARCFLHGLCEQCPAKSWSEHGTLDRPVDYHCEVAHAQARLMGWLRRGEWAWDVEDWTKRTSKR